jgi:glycosyltransferase involved in cell wall biosynthesis
MATPTISVITSTYKRKEKLLKAIRSVQAQTFPDWEMVIVADGPDEEVRQMVEELHDPKIRYFEIPHFGNHSRVKNKGIMESKGEYISFLDDDNAYRPDHLNVLYKAIQRENVDVVYGDRWLIDEEKQIPAQIGVFSDWDAVKIFQYNYIDTSDALIKREALFQLGGCDERYKKFCDWNLWIRMLKAGKKFKRIPLVITDYYLSTDSMSRYILDAKAQNAPAWSAVDVEIELPFLGKIPEPPKVAIFSLTYDRLEYTKQSFESLYKTADYPFDHYVFDNGSTDGTVKWLEKLNNPNGKLHVEYSSDNKGISGASNLILERIHTLGDYQIIGKVDNDCIFQSSGWLAKIAELWRSNHRLALSCYVNGLRDNPGGAARIEYGTLKGELIGMTRHLGGICHFVDADGYKDFKWPEDDTLHGVQDLYFSNELLKRGFQMGYLENLYVSHGPLGTAQQEEDYKDYFERRKTEKTTTYRDLHGDKAP